MNVRLIPTARALILNKQNHILLVSSDGVNWHNPGGWVDGFESLEECLIREIYEELGVKIRVGRLCFVSEFIQKAAHNPFNENIHKIEHHFLAEIVEGDISDIWQDWDADNIKYRRFFSEKDLSTSLIFPVFLRNIFELIKSNNIYQGYYEANSNN